MKKPFLFIFLALGLGFLAVTIFKQLPEKQSTVTGTDPSKRTQSRVIDFWTYYNRATEQRIAGDYPKALDNYLRALEIDSTHLNTLYHLGNVRLALGQYGPALRSWQNLLALHRSSARAHSRLGDVYSCREKNNRHYRLDEATQHYREASALNREETGPLLKLAKIDLIREHWSEARQRLEDVTSSNFRSAEAFFLSSYLDWRADLREKAGKSLDKSVALHTGDASQPKNIGEGETKADASAVLSRSRPCDLLSEAIAKLLTQYSDNRISQEELYNRFGTLLNKYRK